MNLPSSPAIHLIYNQGLPFLNLVMVSEDFGSHFMFPVLLQKSSKQLITLTVPIPGIMMAGIQSLFQGRYQLSHLAVPEIRLSDIFYSLRKFSNAKAPGISSG